jgi:hypothetical protein
MSASLGCAARGGGACPRSAARSRAAADDRAKASGARRGEARSLADAAKMRAALAEVQDSSGVTGRSHATAPRRRRRLTGSCAAGRALHWQGRRGSTRCRAQTSPRSTGRCRRAWTAGRRARPLRRLHEVEQLSATPTPLVACTPDSALIRGASAHAATAAAADAGPGEGSSQSVRRS